MENKLPPLPPEMEQQIMDAWNEFQADTPELQQKLAAGGNSREQYQEALQKAQRELMQAYSSPDRLTFGQRLKNTLHTAIDYGSGFIRTPSMEAAGMLSGPRGREAVTKNFKQDWLDTASFPGPEQDRPAPSMSEWSKRMGWNHEGPLGAKLFSIPWQTWHLPETLRGQSIPPTPGPDVQDAIEMAGEMGFSPGGIAEMNKIGKTITNPRGILNGVGRTALGKGPLYEQGLMKTPSNLADEILQKRAADMARGPTLMKRILGAGLVASDPMYFGPQKFGDAVLNKIYAEPNRRSKAGGHGLFTDVVKEHGLVGTPATTHDKTQQLIADQSRLNKEAGKDLLTEGYHVPGEKPKTGADVTLLKGDLRIPVDEFLDKMALEGKPAMANRIREEVHQTMEDLGFKGIKDLNYEDADLISKRFQEKARDSSAYNMQTTGGNKTPPVDEESRTEARIRGQAFKKIASTARSMQGELADTVSDLTQQFGKQPQSPYSLGTLINLRNRQIGSSFDALPALMERYRMSSLPNSAVRPSMLRDAKDFVGSWGGLGLSRFGGPLGAAGRAEITKRLNPEMRHASPWTLMSIDLNNLGDTSYDQENKIPLYRGWKPQPE